MSRRTLFWPIWCLGGLLFAVMAGFAAATSYFPADLRLAHWVQGWNGFGPIADFANVSGDVPVAALLTLAVAGGLAPCRPGARGRPGHSHLRSAAVAYPVGGDRRPAAAGAGLGASVGLGVGAQLPQWPRGRSGRPFRPSVYLGRIADPSSWLEISRSPVLRICSAGYGSGEGVRWCSLAQRRVGRIPIRSIDLGVVLPRVLWLARVARWAKQRRWPMILLSKPCPCARLAPTLVGPAGQSGR